MYIAQPPLYGAKIGKDERTYLKDEAALRAFEAEHEGRKIEVSRFKGLGEMDWQELGETTMNPATRTLLQVSVEDAAIADEIFSTLMGEDVESRRGVHPGRTPKTCASSTSDPETAMPRCLTNHRPLGNIEPIEIQEEMERSFLDYAMSVITSRALPDARDGLKPVQRRILYGMYAEGMRPDRPHRKSRERGRRGDGASTTRTATSAIYDALARMAQDFSLRYPLIDGHGNFGSPDPTDRPAAPRYTEARLVAARDGAPRRDRRGHRRLRRDLRRAQPASRWCCRRGSRTCWSTAAAASRSAWPRTSRRTTCARSSTRRCT